MTLFVALNLRGRQAKMRKMWLQRCEVADLNVLAGNVPGKILENPVTFTIVLLSNHTHFSYCDSCSNFPRLSAAD